MNTNVFYFRWFNSTFCGFDSFFVKSTLENTLPIQRNRICIAIQNDLSCSCWSGLQQAIEFEYLVEWMWHEHRCVTRGFDREWETRLLYLRTLISSSHEDFCFQNAACIMTILPWNQQASSKCYRGKFHLEAEKALPHKNCIALVFERSVSWC